MPPLGETLEIPEEKGMPACSQNKLRLHDPALGITSLAHPYNTSLPENLRNQPSAEALILALNLLGSDGLTKLVIGIRTPGSPPPAPNLVNFMSNLQ